MAGHSPRHAPVRRARLRRWLRWANWARLPLTRVGELWRSLFPPKPARAPRRRHPVLLDLQGLERREVPQGLFYAALTPAAALGFSAPADFATPGSVLLHGWPGVPLIDYSAAMALTATTVHPAATEDDLSDARLQGVLAAWEGAAGNEIQSDQGSMQESTSDTNASSPLDPFARRTQPQADTNTEEPSRSGSGYHGGLPARDLSLAAASSQSGGGQGSAVTPAVGAAGSTSEFGGAAPGTPAPDLQTAWAATPPFSPALATRPSPASQGSAAAMNNPGGPPVGAAAAPAIAAASTSTSSTAATTDSGSQTLAATTDTPTPAQLAFVSGYGPKALVFEPNVGQTDPQVQYLSHQAGLSVWLTPQGATFQVPLSNTDSSGTGSPSWDVFGLSLAGANANAPLVAGPELLSRSNYFLGSDPGAWYTDVPNYGAVTYQNVYPGIDLVFHGNAANQLEYDFNVAPGADPSLIQVAFSGVQSLSTDSNGNLVLQTPGGPVVQTAPQAYTQSATGTTTAVAVSQVVNADGTLSFQVSGRSADQSLVIDPAFSYATYLGGNGNDYGLGVAADGAGDAYVAGYSTNGTFPTTSGVVQNGYGGGNDAFLVKLDPFGNRLWSTYLGGAENDQANAVAVDPAGNAYLVGYASNTGYPTTSGAYQATGSGVFVSKLSPTGDALLFSTYLGSGTGSGNGIAVDAAGYPYITGSTMNIPTTSGAFQTAWGSDPENPKTNAFVTKLKNDGTGLVYSSYLGGTGADSGNAIAVDSAGNAYVTGYAAGGFPITSGAYQSGRSGGLTSPFLTKVNPAGTALVYSTYISGTNSTTHSGGGQAVAVDKFGYAYIGGYTGQSTFPTTVGSFGDAFGGTSHGFLTKFNLTGSGLVYSGFLGGQVNGLAVDSASRVYAAGYAGAGFPTTSGAFQSTNSAGSQDAFFSQIKSDGSGFLYSTYLGGSNTDSGNAMALDPAGDAFLAGSTSSTDFPVVNAVQSGNGGTSGTSDAFVSRFGIPAAPVVTGISPDTGSSSTDGITNSRNLHILGTAAANATVTVYREELGLLGTVTADSTGAWNFDYSGTTLPEGVFAFKAKQNTGGLTSHFSADYLAKVDLTAPTVKVSLAGTTSDRCPVVQVSAKDRHGLPNGTTVSVDVDLNNDGNFTDAGESGYASGTLTDGHATIDVPTLSSTGTYTLEARVTDRAGNQGTSATVSFQVVTNTPWQVTTQPLSSPDPTADATGFYGNVQVSQPLDLTQGPDWGASEGPGVPALVYNSSEVQDAPVIQLAIPTDPTVSLPPNILVQLTFNGVTSAVTTYSTTGLCPGDTLYASQQPSSAVVSSGRLPWSITVTINYSTPIVQTVTGVAYAISEDSSPFGAGWTFGPTDQLFSIAADGNGPAGVLRVYGTGGARFYQSSGGGAFQDPSGEAGTLTQSGGTYTYQTPDGQTTVFNSAGYETSWTSADGQESWQYRYNGSNQLTGITAPDGALSTFSYNGTTITLQTVNNRTTTLLYTSTTTFTLKQITNPDGGVHSFAYDSHDRVTGETFGLLKNGWSYTSSGEVGSITEGSSGSPSVWNITSLGSQGLTTLVSEGLWVSETDPLGHQTQEKLDSQGRVTQVLAADGGIWQYSYSNGFLNSATDPLGRTTTYARDSQGYVTQETLPDGSTQQYQYQSAFHALTTFTDERGNSSTFAYDSAGHLTGTTDPLGAITAMSWTASGLLQSVTDPLSHTSTYAYDSDRRLTGAEDALSTWTTFSYDANGNLLTTKDARSNVTTTSHDVMGRLTAVQDAVGNRSTMTYDVSGLWLTYKDPLGHLTSLIYDSYNRGLVTEEVDAVGTPAQAILLTTYDGAGNVTATRDGIGYWTNYAYLCSRQPQNRRNLQDSQTFLALAA